MWERIKNNPAMVVATVEAVIVLFAAFGLKLSAEQVASIIALLTLVLGWFVRSQVTPTRKISR
jgi:acid phosphatase family membrane protein YuiD